MLVIKLIPLTITLIPHVFGVFAACVNAAINSTSFICFNMPSLARCRCAPGELNATFVLLLHVLILLRSAGPTCSNTAWVPDVRGVWFDGDQSHMSCSACVLNVNVLVICDRSPPELVVGSQREGLWGPSVTKVPTHTHTHTHLCGSF